MENVKTQTQTALFKISQTRLLIAIQQGLLSMMPFIVVGSFAVLISNFPIPAYQTFLATEFGVQLKAFLSWIHAGTLNIMAMGVLLSISYYIANNAKHTILEQLNPMLTAMVSLGCFVLLSHTGTDFLTQSQVGATGLLIAILVAILASYIFIFFSRHKIQTHFGHGSRVYLSEVMSSIPSAALTILVFALIRLVFFFCGVNDIHRFLYGLLEKPFDFVQGEFPTAILFLLLMQLFWFFGLHGSNMLENVTNRFWVGNMAGDLGQNGLEPAQVFSKTFFDSFVLIGGSGATLALILAALLAFRKANTFTRLSKISIPFALFNINEPIIYGIPLVLNPIFLIPFILVPPVLMCISYGATVLGLVPVVTQEVNWATPVFLSGYMATGSIQGALLQFFNLTIATLIYIPFVRICERAREKSQHQVFDQMNRQVHYFDTHRAPVLLPRQDDIGAMARNLAYDLEREVSAGQELFLVYQPQIDADGNVFGVESLLRWKHKNFGFIPPPSTITLAEEAQVDDALNEWIFKSAIQAKKTLCDLGLGDFMLSINISPLQLRNDRIFEVLEEEMTRNELDPSGIEIELTENVALDESKESHEHMNKLKSMGTKLAIDDFGMGHTSLFYIRSFSFNTVKLDGSLVQSLPHEKSCVDVVGAIIRLAHDQNLHVVAEMVENEEQRDCLLSLGCRIFQGYLYAKPMPLPELIEFLKEHKKASNNEQVTMNNGNG